jgi:hypothetical protein
MAHKLIQHRRGTAAEWTSANPTLAAGEIGFETDTGKSKTGDGTTAWTSLAYDSARMTAAGLALITAANAAAQRTALGATTVGANVFTSADAAAIRTLLSLVPGTDVQAYDADLAALAALTTTSFGRSLLELANAAALRTAAGATTVGGNLLTLANPGAVSFLRVNSDNTVSTRTAAQMLSDLGVSGAVDLQGGTDASGNPNYPSALKGDAYYITVAGKIGGASGKSVDVGDLVIATADNAGGAEGSVGTSWIVVERNIAGITSAGLAIIQAADAAAQAAILSSYFDPAGAAAATQIMTENAQGGDYTLVFGDAAKLVTISHADPKSLTVPPNADVAFPVGTQIAVQQGGEGTLSVVAGAGVTIRSAGGLLDLAGQYSTAALLKLETNTWLLAGSLA